MKTGYYVPNKPLNFFISHFYYFSKFEPQNLIDRFLPDGEIQLLFELSGSTQYIYDNSTLVEAQSCKETWFSGFRTRPICIPSGSGSEMLIVQFKKGRSFPFVEPPVHAVQNMVVDAQLILGPKILEIRNRLIEAESMNNKFKILEKMLVDHWLNRLEVNPFVDYAVSKILARPNQYSIKRLADQVGYSQKHLIQIFKNHVGTTPKEFLKVIRFQRAINQIHQGAIVNWAEIASDCGFFDQSHFVASFKEFAYLTPSQYMQARGEFMNYIPVK